MIVLGLTGSIGMGKSTAADMLRSMNIPVHEADACVHTLMQKDGGAAYPAICAAFPYFEYPDIYKNKTLDRKALGRLVFFDDEKRQALEGIVHPFVREDQMRFIQAQKRLGADIVVLDIPLLFETGAETRVDYTIVVTAPFHVQESRVLARSGMTPDMFAAILKRQMSDGEKRARANYVVQTGLGRSVTMTTLKKIVLDVREQNKCHA